MTTRQQREHVGYITISETREVTELYETAAWFRRYKCQPQTSPLYLARNQGIIQTPYRLYWGLEGVCIDACLVSLFGGVAYGNDTAGKAAIGQSGRVTRSTYAYHIVTLPGVKLFESYEWLKDQESWPREAVDRFLHARGGRLTEYDAQIVNLDYVREHATPGAIIEDLAAAAGK